MCEEQDIDVRRTPPTHPVQEKILLSLMDVIEACEEWPTAEGNEHGEDCDCGFYQDAAGYLHLLRIMRDLMRGTMLVTKAIAQREGSLELLDFLSLPAEKRAKVSASVRAALRTQEVTGGEPPAVEVPQTVKFREWL